MKRLNTVFSVLGAILMALFAIGNNQWVFYAGRFLLAAGILFLLINTVVFFYFLYKEEDDSWAFQKSFIMGVALI